MEEVSLRGLAGGLAALGGALQTVHRCLVVEGCGDGGGGGGGVDNGCSLVDRFCPGGTFTL